MPKCILCGVESDDVARITGEIKKLGKARDVIGDAEVPDVLVLSIPIKNLCPYCADVTGVKHPDPEIVDSVRYYTDLMKLAVPKLQRDIVPPSEHPKIDVDKVKEALFILQDALTKVARQKEQEGELPKEESETMFAEEPEEIVSGWKRRE